MGEVQFDDSVVHLKELKISLAIITGNGAKHPFFCLPVTRYPCRCYLFLFIQPFSSFSASWASSSPQIFFHFSSLHTVHLPGVFLGGGGGGGGWLHLRIFLFSVLQYSRCFPLFWYLSRLLCAFHKYMVIFKKHNFSAFHVNGKIKKCENNLHPHALVSVPKWWVEL